MSRAQGSMWNVKRTFKPHIPITYPHAVLSYEGKVLFVRNYPDGLSRTVVRIPDNLNVKPGWWYDRRRKTFTQEPPE